MWPTQLKGRFLGGLFPDLWDGPGGQSYSLFIDEDEFQGRLAVVYIEIYSSKGKQKVRHGVRTWS